MRLPGKCAGCGKPVELATDRTERMAGQREEIQLRRGIAWCDLGTDVAHECRPSAHRTPVRHTMEGPGGALTPPAVPSPDLTGAEKMERTP